MILRAVVLCCFTVAPAASVPPPPVVLVNFSPYYNVTAATDTFPTVAAGSCSPLTLTATTLPQMANGFAVQAQISGPGIQPVPAQTMSFDQSAHTFIFVVSWCPTTAPVFNTPIPMVFTETGSGGSNPHSFVLIGNTVLPTVQETSHVIGGLKDPVSSATGELYQELAPDFSLGGPLPLQYIRYYGSYLNVNGVTSSLGNNWIGNFHGTIAISGSQASVTIERGKVVRFKQSASGNTWSLVTPDLYGYQLVSAPDGSYRFLNPGDRQISTFSSSGLLSKIEDRSGNALTITYAPGISDVVDGLGRSLHFTFTGNKLTKISDQTGRTVLFTYTGDDLTSFTDAAGKTATYSYMSAGPIAGLMTSSTRPAGNKPYTQTFNNLGLVTQQTDSFGNATTLTYNAASSATTITDPMGSVIQDVHASYNKLQKQTDATSQSSSYTYDDSGRRTSIIDRLGNKTLVTYHDPSGYLASVTDALGATTTYSYTAQSQGGFTFYNLTKITYADGTAESFTFDNFGNVLTATDRAGLVTTSTYNSRGQVLTVTNAAGGVTTYTYNSDGTLASTKSPAGDVTNYTYDSLKRLSQINYPDKTSRAFIYDALDQLLTSTDERGKVTKFAYDANRNLKSSANPLNQSTTRTYDTDDLISTVTDPVGKVSRFQYDANGSLTSRTNGAGEKSSFAYDALNRLVSATDPSGKSVASFAYDPEGRPASLTDALQNTTRFVTDKLGQVTRTTTPLGENFDSSFDALGRLTSSTDALSQVTTYTRDKRGLLTGVNLPGGIGASFTRAELGGIAGITDPNGNLWSRKFDGAGRLVSQTDPLGQASSYSYDSRDRVNAISNPDSSVQVSYDAGGNVIQRQYADGTVLNFTYDDANRSTGGAGVTLVRDAAGRIVSSNGLTIGRDAVGRVSSVTYAAGIVVTYTRDARGLITQVADWAGGVTKLAYDDARRLISITRPNGVVTQLTYDKNSRLSASIESGGGNTLASLTLTRDALGKIRSAARSVPQPPAPAPGTLPITYDDASQISGATYDAQGKLTADGFRTYTWNQASELVSYTGADGSASFTYDAFRQRISRTGGDGTTQNYVLNYAFALPVVATVQSGGADLRYYVYLPDGSLLYSIEAADNTRHFFHFDEAGSTIMLTDDTGAITDSYGITPYGETVTQTGTTDNRFTFLGQLGVMQEPGTSLYYMRFRYYDSAPARFLSRDPLQSLATVPSLDPREVNPYQYVVGNPLQIVDPLGLKPAVCGNEELLAQIVATITAILGTADTRLDAAIAARAALGAAIAARRVDRANNAAAHARRAASVAFALFGGLFGGDAADAELAALDAAAEANDARAAADANRAVLAARAVRDRIDVDRIDAIRAQRLCDLDDARTAATDATQAISTQIK
jgi:RHS repeat-associated protein